MWIRSYSKQRAAASVINHSHPTTLPHPSLLGRRRLIYGREGRKAWKVQGRKERVRSIPQSLQITVYAEVSVQEEISVHLGVSMLNPRCSKLTEQGRGGASFHSNHVHMCMQMPSQRYACPSWLPRTLHDLIFG